MEKQATSEREVLRVTYDPASGVYRVLYADGRQRQHISLMDALVTATDQASMTAPRPV